MVEPGTSSWVSLAWKVSTLSHGDREGMNTLPETMEILCFRDRYDLTAESAIEGFDATLTDREALGRNQPLLQVVEHKRVCEWFESHRLGLSLEGHLDVQERRREWKRTAAVALVAASLGGTMAMIPSVIALLR